MKIILLRHGRPQLHPANKISPCQMADWIRAYDSAGIGDDYPAQHAISELATDIVVSSDLPRAIESAHKLGKTVFLADPLFREMELPVINFRWPILAPAIWVIIYRLLWLCGFSGNAESCRVGKARAKKAALSLVELAESQGSVLLVGHGMMNHFIAKYLLSQGWREIHNSGNRYWDYRVMEISRPASSF